MLLLQYLFISGTLFILFCYIFWKPDKTIKLWKVSERNKRPEGYNLKDDAGILRDPSSITSLRVPTFKPMELMVEASPRRVFANAHTYHINSISVNSDQETYLSADDLRINLWHVEITDQSFSILVWASFTFNLTRFLWWQLYYSFIMFNVLT